MPSQLFQPALMIGCVPTPQPSRTQADTQKRESAMAAARAFISSVAYAIQTPLTMKTKKPQATPAATPTILCRIRRIAKTDNNSNVRPSKKGEILLMHKLGVIQPDAPVTKEAQEAYATLFDRPLPPEHLVAIRDLFHAAQVLSDSDLAAALAEVGEQAPAMAS